MCQRKIQRARLLDIGIQRLQQITNKEAKQETKPRQSLEASVENLNKLMEVVSETKTC